MRVGEKKKKEVGEEEVFACYSSLLLRGGSKTGNLQPAADGGNLVFSSRCVTPVFRLERALLT